jgi:hypothetical protein
MNYKVERHTHTTRNYYLFKSKIIEFSSYQKNTCSHMFSKIKFQPYAGLSKHTLIPPLNAVFSYSWHQQEWRGLRRIKFFTNLWCNYSTSIPLNLGGFRNNRRNHNGSAFNHRVRFKMVISTPGRLHSTVTCVALWPMRSNCMDISWTCLWSLLPVALYLSSSASVS